MPNYIFQNVFRTILLQDVRLGREKYTRDQI
jgi:hypothetical protein